MFKQQKAFKQKNARFYEEDMDLLNHLEGKDFTKYVKELIRHDLHGSNLSYVEKNISYTENGSTNTITTVSNSNIDNTSNVATISRKKISRSSLG